MLFCCWCIYMLALLIYMQWWWIISHTCASLVPTIVTLYTYIMIHLISLLFPVIIIVLCQVGSKYCLLFVSPLRCTCSINNIEFYAAARWPGWRKIQMFTCWQVYTSRRGYYWLVMPFCWHVYMASTTTTIVLEFCDVCFVSLSFDFHLTGFSLD